METDDSDDGYEVLIVGREGGYPVLLGLSSDDKLPECPDELPLLTGENDQFGSLYGYWEDCTTMSRFELE